MGDRATSTSVEFRADASGQQLGFMQALENMKAKFELLEGRMTTNAQHTTQLEQRLVELQNRMNSNADTTAQSLKTAQETKQNLLEACGNIVARYSTLEHVDTINTTLEARFDVLEATITALVSAPVAGEQSQTQPTQQQPQTFNVHTPLRGTEPPPGFGNARDDMQEPATDPWNRYAPQSGAPMNPRYPVRPPPEIPHVWQSGESPFVASAQPPRPQPQHQHFGQGTERMGDQKSIHRHNDDLYKFSGQAIDFKTWSDKVVDHMNLVHVKWRPALMWLSTTNEDLSFNRLSTEAFGPLDERADELAVKFEGFLVKWLPLRLYERRSQLCGGREEMNNGFIMWRRLFREYTGTGAAVTYAGTEALRLYPRCDRISDLSSHIDGWKDLLDRYGQELEHAESMKRSMFLNIIPATLKTKIMDEEELQNKGLTELIMWCRNRSRILQTEELAEMTRKQITSQFGKKGIHSVQGRQEEKPHEAVDIPVPDHEQDIGEVLKTAPAWAQKLFAVRQAPPPPSPHSASRPLREPRGRAAARDGSRGRNDRSPRSGSRNRLIDWGNKCFHCGSSSHTRNNCESFKKMTKDHNGSKPAKDWKPPPGYESALAKAKKAAKAKEDKNKPKINAMLTDDDDTASEGGFSELGQTSFFIQALTPAAPKTKTSNAFAGLTEDEQEFDGNVLEGFNDWAHKVYTARTKRMKPVIRPSKVDRTANFINGPKKPEPVEEAVIIRKGKDLDRASTMMPALPVSRKAIAKIVKKLPKSEDGGKEIQVLMDSGSFTHALDAEEELPGWFIEPPDLHMADKIAETACGGQLKASGAVTVTGDVDGHQIRIRFAHINGVRVPILSVRCFVEDENEVTMDKKGGFIRHKMTRKCIPF